MDFSEGGRANSFQHGDICWWPDTGAKHLGDVVLHYTGFYCFQETGEDAGTGADEPYAVLGVFTPEGQNTVTTRVYEGVNSNHSQPDSIEMWRGRPYGMEINIRLLEHDFGDVSEDRKKMVEAFKMAHDEGVKALKAIPVMGPAISVAVDALLGKVVPEFGGAVFDLFDLGDDTIGKATLRVSGRDMVLTATRSEGNSEFHGIGYRIESPFLSGNGGSYKVYFGLVPA